MRAKLKLDSILTWPNKQTNKLTDKEMMWPNKQTDGQTEFANFDIDIAKSVNSFSFQLMALRFQIKILPLL